MGSLLAMIENNYIELVHSRRILYALAGIPLQTIHLR